MKSEHKPYGPYEKYFKRPLDFCCGMAAILVFWWLYLIVAILVQIKLGNPVLFKQKRPGKDEKIFTLYKFRTMTDERDENGKLLPDEVRLTKFGKMLRATSLDELPEAWNLINGSLSTCGPRPLLARDVKYMTNEQKRRHSVRPGLTGLAQCNGRNSLDWDTKLAKDIEYVDNISFILDLKILIKTILKVIKKEDITFEKGADMDLKDWIELKRKNDKEE